VRALAPLVLVGLLGGCATSHVTLLPGEPGSPLGAIAVLDAKSEAERGVIDGENMRAALNGSAVKPRPVKATEYAALVSAMPPPPHHFVVYFLAGSTTLAPGSEPVLNQMFQELTLRSGAEIQIIGHTDTVGSAEDNDALSIKRAEEIRDVVVALGRLDLSIARYAGRGERELLIATEDNVAEPANRRVEIVVR